VRKITWGLLLAFAFAIPWEYSLDLGGWLGNVARVIGLLMLLAAMPAVLQAGHVRISGPMQWLVLALFLWFCCTFLWTIEPLATLEKLRGYAQEMMVVWLVWEFAESPRDLRALLRAFIAGSWVLAALTLANFRSAEVIAAGQVRFFSEGQDPNDVARFLDLCFPLAALLANCERGWPARLLALGYLPLGFLAVVLTASRGGFVGALAAFAGCGLLLMRSHRRAVFTCALVLPALSAALWFVVPRETLERLATIPEQLQGGDLNQRLNIWHAGWLAFSHSPLLGTGVGSFVAASGMNPIDTAHNTTLSILVGSGLIGLFLVSAIVVFALHSILVAPGQLKTALATALMVWGIASLVSTLEESRATWLLLAMIALADRLAIEQPAQLTEYFTAAIPADRIAALPRLSSSGAD
jgi:O-antigen ligase